LIGAETYTRRWVRYEIIKSFDKGNGLLGIYIHKIKDQYGKTDSKGKNPFEYVGVYIDRNGNFTYPHNVVGNPASRRWRKCLKKH